MSKTIAILRQDHKNMSQLLDAIERQFLVFKDGGVPDYEIVLSAVEYCLNYPDLKHHPLEDMIVKKLRVRTVKLDAGISDLLREHEALATVTRRLAAAVNSVLREAEVPRDAFAAIVDEFLAFYREHIKKEEIGLFPLALTVLTSEDWDEIEAHLKDEEDPVFGSSTDETFQTLRENILAWDLGDQSLRTQSA